MGPSQHVEEVLLGSQLHENKIREIHNNNQYECLSISNCNAEEGDERGATERDPELTSESKATEINHQRLVLAAYQFASSLLYIHMQLTKMQFTSL
jgi:hypothetical protein